MILGNPLFSQNGKDKFSIYIGSYGAYGIQPGGKIGTLFT